MFNLPQKIHELKVARQGFKVSKIVPRKTGENYRFGTVMICSNRFRRKKILWTGATYWFSRNEAVKIVNKQTGAWTIRQSVGGIFEGLVKDSIVLDYDGISDVSGTGDIYVQKAFFHEIIWHYLTNYDLAVRTNTQLTLLCVVVGYILGKFF